MIDTSVLAAGIAGFKPWWAAGNPSASLLREWLANATFAWLVAEEILGEYKEVLTKLGVRRNLIGEVINRLREEAEFVTSASQLTYRPIRTTIRSALVQSRAAAFIATLNRKDFPQKKLSAKVISLGDPMPTTRRRRLTSS